MSTTNPVASDVLVDHRPRWPWLALPAGPAVCVECPEVLLDRAGQSHPAAHRPRAGATPATRDDARRRDRRRPLAELRIARCSSARWMTTARPDGSPARDNPCACAVVADTQPCGDLRQREARSVEPRHLLSRLLGQPQRAARETSPPRHLTDHRAMYPEAGRKLLHGHALGVGSQQRGPIAGVPGWFQ